MTESPPSTLPTTMWRPGASEFPVLFERYQILGVLGEGGMGTVFKGYHLNLKRFVAIKTLRVDLVNNPGLVSRFLREMELVGGMDHPNVVRAADAGEKNGVFYLFMEYLDGMNLSHLVNEKRQLLTADACELARQAALGLEHIHKTLVHRDIKPSNLMLTTAGLVKVLDLGLALLTEARTGDSERTPEGLAVGTYDYMAPEQAGGGVVVDARADVYGLGCTLFRLLTGRAPFSGPSFDSVPKKLYAHSHIPLTAVEEFHSIPPKLGEVLLRMTAKDPAGRYASAREVAETLTPFAACSQPLQLLERGQDDAATAVRPLSWPLPDQLSRLTRPYVATPCAPAESKTPVETTPGSGRRKRLWIALSACVLAALACGLAWFMLNGKEPTTPTTSRLPIIPPLSNSPRALDELASHLNHRLLDRLPVPVGCDGEDPRKWHWDQGQEHLEVKGPDTLLFITGTTSRSSFTLEAGISQAPWSGNVGVFWGYHEDADARKTLERDFAWFQMAVIAHKKGTIGEDIYSVQRGNASLRYDARGDMRIHSHFWCKDEVPQLIGGEKILMVEVSQNRLKKARLGSTDLNAFSSDQANSRFAPDSYPGALGVISLGHSVTFSNVRFIAHSNK